MADYQFMSWGPDWPSVDDMSNYAATGWVAGTGVTQQSGYVRIDRTGNTTDYLYKVITQTIPLTFDMEVASQGTANAISVGDGTNRVWVYFPNNGGVKKYYRLIVRQFSTRRNAVCLYENGVLIKNKADSIQSTTYNTMYFFVTSSAVAGDFLEIYTCKYTFGADFGAPSSDKMVDTIYFDGRAGYELLFNLSGTGMAPRSFVEDRIPFEAGSIYRQTIIDPRDVTLGLKVTGATKSDLNDKMRTLRRTLLNPGKLFVKMSDGYRYLNCRYSHGLEGDIKPDVTGQLTQLLSLNFRAFDPYWYSVLPVIKGFVFATGPVSVIPVTNNGDVEAWPEFYIYGPGTNPTIQNLTTGKQFQLTVSLPTNNDFVYVRTQPGNRTIQDKNGATAWNLLSTGQNTFWSLIPGDNSLKISFASGTDTTTYTQMYYYERYEGE